MNKYISKILISVGIFTIILINANSVSAVSISNYGSSQDCSSGWTTPIGCNNRGSYYPNNNYNSNGYNNFSNQNSQQYKYTTGTQTQKPVVNNNYYYPTTKTTSDTKPASTSTDSKSTTDKNSRTDGSNINTKNMEKVNTNQLSSSGLTALSFRGTGGFLPSSFWQWLIVVFLILVIVILARLISKSTHHKEADIISG